MKSKIKHHPTGLETKVKHPNYFPTAPKGSDILQSLLRQLYSDLLDEVLHAPNIHEIEPAIKTLKI